MQFAVRFSVPVTGVDPTDFVPAGPGGTDATIMDVSGSGDSYSIEMITGLTGEPIRLDVTDDDSIRDLCLHPLGGVGMQNGSFSAGVSYPAAP